MVSPIGDPDLLQKILIFQGFFFSETNIAWG
jgi:hypothetical protein